MSDPNQPPSGNGNGNGNGNNNHNLTSEERISENAKIILISLFVLIGFTVGFAGYVTLVQPEISTEVLSIVFASAITGGFTLGGTLIQTLWGK